MSRASDRPTGTGRAERFVATARSATGDAAVVSPAAAKVRVLRSLISGVRSLRWYDPASGALLRTETTLETGDALELASEGERVLVLS